MESNLSPWLSSSLQSLVESEADHIPQIVSGIICPASPPGPLSRWDPFPSPSAVPSFRLNSNRLKLVFARAINASKVDFNQGAKAAATCSASRLRRRWVRSRPRPCRDRCVPLDLVCKNYYFAIKTSGSMRRLRRSKRRANWISRLRYKPINLTPRQLMVNGPVQYR